MLITHQNLAYRKTDTPGNAQIFIMIIGTVSDSWLCLSGSTKIKMDIFSGVLVRPSLYQHCSKSSHILSNDFFRHSLSLIS